MTTTDLRARAWDIITDPANGARFRADWSDAPVPISERTFAVTVEGIDDPFPPEIDGDLMTVTIPTEDLTGRPRWTLWETTTGTPRKIITGRVLLSGSGTDTQDAGPVTILEDEVAVTFTIIGERGPQGESFGNIDGGHAGSVYGPTQRLDLGAA